MKNSDQPRCQMKYQNGNPCRFIGWFTIKVDGKEKLSCYSHQKSRLTPDACSYCGDPMGKHPNLICKAFRQ